MRSKASNQNKFLRIVTLPLRALIRARDSYVKSMTNCAERGSFGGFMDNPSGKSSSSSSLPKSFSVSSSSSSNYESDDLRELIRVASVKRMGGRVEEVEFSHQRQQAVAGVVPRSCSVGMGRIDEERPCDFGEEDGGVGKLVVYPRSKSYAVATKRRNGAAF